METLNQLTADAVAALEKLGGRLLALPGAEAFFLGGGVLAVLLALVLVARWRHRSGEGEESGEREIQELIARNQYSEAGERRMSQGQFDKALALFLNSGDTHKAALCYLALKQPARAALMYVKMGRQAEAAHYFQTAGNWREAAECLHSLGSEREAAELYERAGELAKAAHLMRSMGDAENAARLFERAGLGAEAGSALLQARGRDPQALRRAGELFESAGERGRAAECYAAAGEWLRAAEIFEAVGDLNLAAKAFERVSEWARAAHCYERANSLTEARKNYGRAGDHLKVAQLAVDMGDLFDAATCFYRLGSYERAIETLQQISPSAPEARKATLLLGRIFLEKGLGERAREKFESLEPAEPTSQADLEVLYHLADAHEKCGDPVTAITTLERIIEVDESYGDASEKLERLQEKAYSESNPAPGYYEGRYELLEEIGRGGMGIVYLAHDSELQRQVAIKFLPGELAINPSAVKMFRQEARSAAAMNHPNIVTIYDVAVIEGRPCIVMEYVRGQTVRELMRSRGRGREGALPVRKVVEIGHEVAVALTYAHERNVIHRDVKPGNILIAESGQVKLMDFGISKVLEAGGEGMTLAKGTPQYMPPEQILGRGVDGRSDVYALGISMFEMAAGRRPFGGEDVVDQQLHSAIPDPRTLKPDIPESFVDLIRKACEKRPADRFSSAAAMAQRFREYVSELKE